MTSINNIENLIIKTYNKSINMILSIFGFGGLFMGVINLLYYEILTSVCYDNKYFITYISMYDK